MDREQFKRKYEDTHVELAVNGPLSSNGSLIRNSPGDRNARAVKKYKKGIELECMNKKKEALQNFMLDTVAVRAEDMLDRKQLPMKDLLKVAVSALPHKVEVEANVTNSFLDLYNTIETESTKVEIEDADFEEEKS